MSHYPALATQRRPAAAASPTMAPAVAPDLDPAAAVVFVIDSDVAERRALKALVEAEGWRCAPFADTEGFLAHPPPTAANCLIVDISPPHLGGLELQARLAARRSHSPVIFTTRQADIPTSVRAMKAGALEFLAKPLDTAVLLCAVREALACSAESRRREAALQALRTRHASLSRRESEVMDRVVAGLLNKQVAFELGISEITVKSHRGRVMAKMDARSLADLVRMSLRLTAAGVAAVAVS
jgi:FixJ family two-component response regulator